MKLKKARILIIRQISHCVNIPLFFLMDKIIKNIFKEKMQFKHFLYICGIKHSK